MTQPRGSFTVKAAKALTNEEFAIQFNRIELGKKPSVRLYPLNEAAPPCVVRSHWHATRYRTRRGLLYERLKRIKNGRTVWVRLVPKASFLKAREEVMKT